VSVFHIASKKYWVPIYLVVSTKEKGSVGLSPMHLYNQGTNKGWESSRCTARKSPQGDGDNPSSRFR
jgi:hypothetical protein